MGNWEYRGFKNQFSRFGFKLGIEFIIKVTLLEKCRSFLVYAEPSQTISPIPYFKSFDTYNERGL